MSPSEINAPSMLMMTCRQASGMRKSTPSTAFLEDDHGQEGEEPQEAEADEDQGRRQGEIGAHGDPQAVVRRANRQATG
jgi:hypothetical protein